MNRTEINNTIVSCLSKYNPAKIGVFGSFARNENTKDSDIDILVDFIDPISFLDFVGIEQELSEILGIKVDLVTGRSVDPKLKKYIERDLKIIFE